MRLPPNTNELPTSFPSLCTSASCDWMFKSLFVNGKIETSTLASGGKVSYSTWNLGITTQEDDEEEYDEGEGGEDDGEEDKGGEEEDSGEEEEELEPGRILYSRFLACRKLKTEAWNLDKNEAGVVLNLYY